MRLATVTGLVAALLAAAPWLTLPAPAQEPGRSLRVEAVDTEGHPEVELRIIAPGELVDHTLEDGDVTVSEGGVLRAAEVQRLPGVEQEVVLVIDVSGSMEGHGIAGVRAATAQFLERVPSGTRVAVVAFAGEPSLAVPFTDDHQAVAGAVEGLQPGGNTALYDGVVFAAGLFEGARGGARTLVVLADGEDNASTSGVSAAIEAMRAAATSAYAVELRTGATDPVALGQLVGGVNGQVAGTDDPAELQGIYDAVAVEVASRYRLRYRSAAHGVTDLEVAVQAGGVHQRVGGIPLHLPEQPGWRAAMTAPSALLAGLLVSYAALGLVVFLVLFPRPARVDLALRASGRPVVRVAGISGLAGRATRMADWLLRYRNQRAGLATALELAGLRMRPGEFTVLALSGTLAAAAGGLLLGGPVLGLVLAVAVAVASRMLLGHLARRRRNAFADQLDDTLQLVASSLRAGLSLMQSVQAVSRDAEPPTSEEFRRLVNETRLGRDLGETLEELGERMQSKDFQWVGQAIEIHREVGGDLAEVLDTVGETIRDRGQMRRQVQALSAEGKLSAIILMGLPLGILAFLGVTNPGYLEGFTSGPAGWAMVAVGVGLLLVGGVWLRKMVQIQY